MGEGWPTRRKYITMNVTYFAALAVFILAFAVVMIYKPGRPTAGDLERLQKGTTPAAVATVLGEPYITLGETTQSGSYEETWTYHLPASHWSVTRQTYQLKFFDGQFDSWWKVQ